MLTRTVLVHLFFVLCLSGAATYAQDPETVVYRLSFPAPQTQTVDVEMEVVAAAGELTLHLPTWRPGKYQILDPSGSLSRVEADDVNGEPLTVQKSAKSTWKVTVPRRGAVRIRYSIYANELGLRTRHVDATHAFLSGSSVFLYSPALRSLPVRVEFDLPDGWRIAGGLERASDDAVTAPNYDVLVDSPIEVGEHDLYTYEQNGKTFEVVVWPAGVALDQENLLEDFAEITDEHYDIFGSAPFDRYVFLLHASSGARGGTEHLNSTIMQTSLEAVEGSFERSDAYKRLLGLTSHEFFHTWNVKALRPDGIQPYDYQNENYSTLFWVAEGTTSYYDQLTLARRERIKVKKYLDDLGKSIDAVRNRPGSRVQSVADASFDAWVKFNKPSPNSSNTTVSFYRRGALVSLLFDAWVRRESDGSNSLDTVLRTLYERHPLEAGGFSESDLRQTLQEAADSDPSELFDRYVHGTDELPLEEALATMGVELYLKPPKKPEGDSDEDESEAEATKLRAELGLQLRERDGRTVLGSVASDGPSYAAGLQPGDELVALDGRRLRSKDLKQRLELYEPGDTVELVVLRRDLLQTFTVALAGRPEGQWALRHVESPTDAQKSVYRSWIGQDFPEKKSEGDDEDE